MICHHFRKGKLCVFYATGEHRGETLQGSGPTNCGKEPCKLTEAK